ncbi:MAG: carboxypeptidase-like regulatory domain-containing protein, partial [Bacteroidota bacterium]
MRYWILVLFLLAICPKYNWAQKNPGEGEGISEIFDQVPLNKVLKKLRKTYDLKIAYEDNLTKGIVVTLRIENATPEETISSVLKETSLNYLFVNDKIIIIPRVKDDPKLPKPTRYDLTVSGVIKDGVNGETLPNAIIRIVGTSKGAVSNVDGFFTILKVPNDTCTLQIDYLGYMSKKIKLDGNLELSQLSIDLQSDIAILKDVTITDTYDAPVEVSDQISKVAFNPRSLANLPSLGEHDLFKTVQLLSGISGTNESSANLIIRGALPSQNLVLLDGFTVYHLDHFFGIFSALNTDIIKDVQIYKGGFDSKYGGRVSGVVDITGKSGNTKKTRYNLGANLMSVRGSVEIPITQDLGILVSYRRAFTDIIQSRLYEKLFDIARENDEQLTRPIDDPRFADIEPTFFFSDFNSKISYRPSEKDNIALSLYAGADNLTGFVSNELRNEQFDVSFEDNLTEITEWGNIGFSLRWGRQWSEKHYSNIRVSSASFFRDYSFDYNFQFDSGGVERALNFGLRQENRVGEASFNFDHEYLLTQDIALEFGAAFVNHDISYTTFTDDEIADQSADAGNVSSIYSTINFKVSKDMTASIGG